MIGEQVQVYSGVITKSYGSDVYGLCWCNPDARSTKCSSSTQIGHRCEWAMNMVRCNASITLRYICIGHLFDRFYFITKSSIVDVLNE